MPSPIKAAFAILLAASPIAGAQAFELSGTKQVALQTRDGASIPIGTIDFTPTAAGDHVGYRLNMEYARFKTFFLSMRDFKCLEGPEIECYVPYPYPNPHWVTPTDLRWLEHDLLFFFKQPNAYGAKLSDGLYYALTIGPNGIEGRPQAIDLDQIAAPPADLKTPPFRPEDRDDVPEGSRWIAALTIR